MKSYSVIRQGLIDTLKRISPANGYQVQVPDDRVYPFYAGDLLDTSDDAQFPMLMVVLNSAARTQQPGYQFHRTCFFLVYVILKQRTPEENPSQQLELFMDAIERAIAEDSSLNGTVNNANVVLVEPDEGVLAPKAAAIITVETLETT